MEFIKNIDQFEKMIDNKILGEPELINSKINFFGKNNILFCDNNIKLNNVELNFRGDNSLVYLSSSLENLFNLDIYHNSLLFIGKNVKMGAFFRIRVHENQNVILADDCIVGDNVTFVTSEGVPIYDCENKERINFSKSIYVGDHVYLGNYSFISKGVKIGSGSIVGDCSFIPYNSTVPSNVYLLGNPAKIVKTNVFFTEDTIKSFKYEDSNNSKYYKSDVFIFNYVKHETLSLDSIDKIIFELNLENKLEFVQKLFIRNKQKNRFSIN